MAEPASEDRKKALKTWIRQKENLALVLIVACTIIVRLYYFFKLGNQPIWWDEGDYLSIAKIWATGMSTPEWWSHFTGIRPLLLPLIWAGLFHSTNNLYLYDPYLQ